MKFQSLDNQTEFTQRHIGPNETEIQTMLQFLKLGTLDDLANNVIPQNIRSTHNPKIGSGISEFELLNEFKNIMSQNKIFDSLIGMGFHDTVTPTVIQRNILENPVWYTAYTPYQPEIAQGRLEALLNFQTLIKDLTAMDISNASLLDEGSAAAEAMTMAYYLQKKNPIKQCLVSSELHPHVLNVLKTRALPLGIELIITDVLKFDFSQNVFASILSYPNSTGEILDYKNFADKIHQQNGLVIVDVELFSLALLTPPGEWGADIVVGNSQRFGVPLGFGGPHAAFLATKEEYKRIMPGRLVGVSIDSQNQPALRLALQTREQHIRREKATSNICTAQVLLANMASMYAVYHGPRGIQRIAQRIQRLTQMTALGLQKLGFQIETKNYFDTISVKVDDASQILNKALALKMNFRKLNESTLCFSLNETHSLKTVQNIWNAFSGSTSLNIEALDQEAEKISLPSFATRSSKYLTHPVFNSHHSETQMLRYIHSLQNKDLTLTHSMIPLGSCTMKLNATTELVPVSWPEVNKIHPFAPADQTQGYTEMIQSLEKMLCELTGFDSVSLQPNAGSQGEYAGLLAIKKYLESKNQPQRDICLIPSSAHGTNPASAVMAGMKVIVVQCDQNGNVDVQDLKLKAQEHSQTLAALMITYPSTHGVFEESIQEICQIIHNHGGQVYMDGANLNALVGVCRPGEFGADVSHMNLHKTFSIPHGGGGPGVGPIGVKAHLTPFLPNSQTGEGAVTSAPFGSASILPISWSYIKMMGDAGIKKSTLTAILSANYIAKKLDPHFSVLYKGQEGLVAHECIIDLRPLKKESGIDVTDVAKRLMDYGFHSPTMSFPVPGTMMIEPTESESLAELERFIEAMILIRKEIQDVIDKKVELAKSPLTNAPHTAQMLLTGSWDRPYSRETAAYPMDFVKKNKYWPASARIDNAYGDRNLICSCPSIEEYTTQ